MAQSTSSAASQSQQNNPAAMVDGWRKLADEQIARMGQTFDEFAKLEAASIEQAREAVRELARLTEESLGYTARLAAEWRKLGLDAARSAADLMKPRA